MGEAHQPERKEIYQISVQGRLDESWADWFDGFQICFADDTTTITGPVVDQVALRALLETLWDLNLTVISVVRS